MVGVGGPNINRRAQQLGDRLFARLPVLLGRAHIVQELALVVSRTTPPEALPMG
jgi:hypothetical protein